MDILQTYQTQIYAAIGIVVLAILIAIVLRVFRKPVRGGKGNRLGISEYYEIDKSRRLVLVRRDDVEHLVLIGGAQDVVVESDIGSPLEVAPPQAVVRPAPRPAVFAGRRPSLRPVENTDLRGGPREEPQM